MRICDARGFFLVVNRGLRIRYVAMRVVRLPVVRLLAVPARRMTGRQRLLKHRREQFCVPGLERMRVPGLEQMQVPGLGAMCALSRVLMSDREDWCGRRFRTVPINVCEGSKESSGVRRESLRAGEMKRRLILPPLNLRNHPAQTPRPANPRAPNPAPNPRGRNPVGNPHARNHRVRNRRHA
jgi:hypothetical protein